MSAVAAARPRGEPDTSHPAQKEQPQSGHFTVRSPGSHKKSTPLRDRAAEGRSLRLRACPALAGC